MGKGLVGVGGVLLILAAVLVLELLSSSSSSSLWHNQVGFFLIFGCILVGNFTTTLVGELSTCLALPAFIPVRWFC